MANPAETVAVRAGEELDLTRLEPMLTAAGLAGPWTVTQYPAGHSNLTYLLTNQQQSYVLRRPPVGNQVKSAHDMGREFKVLSRLAPVYPLAPKPLLICEDESVLGAPFYVMERRPGLVLRAPLPATLDTRPETMRRLCLAFIDNLARLHSLDYQAAGLADLGKPEGYAARQVEGWSKRYLAAKTDEIKEIEEAAAWLRANLPPSGPPALIHNDYKFDNVAVDPDEPTRLVAVFDWEMATIGDPLLDLGTTLGYWMEADDGELLPASAVGPTNLPGCLRRAELVARWEEQTGRRVEALEFYRCFGLFKIAVIIQQIYARYRKGLTQDARFAALGQKVREVGAALAKIAV